MSIAVGDIKAEVEPIHYADGSWGFRVRYWLFDPQAATTYYQFNETFPTKAEVLAFAERVAGDHFRKNCGEIMKRLAELSQP